MVPQGKLSATTARLLTLCGAEAGADLERTIAAMASGANGGGGRGAERCAEDFARVFAGELRAAEAIEREKAKAAGAVGGTGGDIKGSGKGGGKLSRDPALLEELDGPAAHAAAGTGMMKRPMSNVLEMDDEDDDDDDDDDGTIPFPGTPAKSPRKARAGGAGGGGGAVAEHARLCRLVRLAVDFAIKKSDEAAKEAAQQLSASRDAFEALEGTVSATRKPQLHKQGDASQDFVRKQCKPNSLKAVCLVRANLRVCLAVPLLPRAYR